MIITFFIGNGFDIRMGIKSSYKEAEKNYIGLVKKSSILKRFQESLSSNGKYWANFESALGKYTGQFESDKQLDFFACADDFNEELIRYLQSEEEKIDYQLCADEIKKEFKRSVSNYNGSVPNRYCNELDGIISQGRQVTFRFVSFNYTHILDRCLSTTFDKSTSVGSHVHSSSTYNHYVDNTVLHLHGELPGPIIMGVDNKKQISNQPWAEQRRFCQRLAKPDINNRAGSLVDDSVMKLIKDSSIICLYGMSLGETDKTWWISLGKWLKDPGHRLIIFGHSDRESDVALTHQQQFSLQYELTDTFLDLAEIQGAQRDELENRIFVVINPNLFNINLVELTQKKKQEQKIVDDLKVKELQLEFEKASKLTTV